MSERFIVPLVTVIGAVVLWLGTQHYLSISSAPDTRALPPKGSVIAPVEIPATDSAVATTPETETPDEIPDVAKGEYISTNQAPASDVARLAKPGTEIALEVSFLPAPDGNCSTGATAPENARISFSIGSEIMRGSSMSALDKLILRYQQCAAGQFTIKAAGDTATARLELGRRRQDEVKYYLMQRQIPKNNMTFPDPS